MTARCPAVQIWPDSGGYIGVRLACVMPAGHDGEHWAADVQTIHGPREAL